MTIVDKINEYQDKLRFILTDAEAKESFRKKIDQFPPDKIENLTNYWNQSLKNLSDKFQNFLKDIQYDDNGNISKEEVEIKFLHNAATKTDKYVKPFYNRNGENYLEAREDENTEVLNNYNEMDFTIYQSLIQQINSCITRLIMPRYRRNVEIEDLDRNFWVIGQNLTLLNKLILDLRGLFGEDLIAELCGLWDNIYRLWQAIFGLVDLTDNINTNEKIRIILHIPENGYKKAINNNLVYFSYNEILKQITNKTNKEIIQEYHIDNSSTSIVQLDCNKDTQVNLSSFFQMALEKNFAVLKNYDEDGQRIYDICSLSFTDRENFEMNGYTWYKKTIKIEHLWIDFVCDNGYIYTYTDNNFGNQTKLLNYDFNISIPLYFNQIDNKIDFSYHDIIRINKPVPYLRGLEDNKNYMEHVDAFNDGGAWIYKNGEDPPVGYDGFYGINFSEYPSSRSINTIKSSYFKLSNNNLFSIRANSSDLIDCRHTLKGQTYIENEYAKKFTEKEFILNLRYLIGRTNNQEVEILTTKDRIGAPVKYVPIINIANDNIGKITYTINNGNKTNFRLDLSLANDVKKSIGINKIKTSRNTLNMSTLWNEISGYLEAHYLAKAGNLQDREMKVYLPCVFSNPWCNDGVNVYNSGVRYLFVVCVYRIGNTIKFKKIFNIDKKIDFFKNSKLQDAIKDTGLIASNAYFPWVKGMAVGGFSMHITDYSLEMSDTDLNMQIKQLEGRIRYNDILENSAMTVSGSINSKNEWVVKKITGRPLGNYNIPSVQDSERYSKVANKVDQKYRKPQNVYIYGGKIENNKVITSSTKIKLTPATTPWSENVDWE